MKKECDGKSVHFKKDDAQRKADKLNNDKYLRMKVEVYQCPDCTYWHCRRTP